MKKLLLFAFVALLFASCGAPKETFTVKGDIKGLNSRLVYLKGYDASQQTLLYADSVMTDSLGRFEFHGTVPYLEVIDLYDVFATAIIAQKLKIYEH